MPSIRFDRPIAGQANQTLKATDLPGLLWTLVAVIAALALTVGYLLGTRTTSNQAQTAPEQAAASTAASASGRPLTMSSGAELWGPGVAPQELKDISQVHRRIADDPFAIGPIDAPVVISEFSDFECPFCSRHANQVEPAILKYVKEGKVRLEWNDFPVNGPYAVDSAKAGRAAAAQGKFHEYKTALYRASQDIQGHPEFTIEDFEKFAKEAGVKDLKQFREDATGDRFDDAVTNARSYASQLGITGTPAFIVGNKFISGAQPEEVFIKAIEEQL